MPGGVRLGGAYFELEASSAPLIQALKQAEDASQKSVQKISQATGIAEKDVQRFAQTYIAAEKQRADASAAATLKIIKAHNDAAAATSKASSGFGELLKAGVGLGAGLAGVTLGIEGVRKGLELVAEETQKAGQAQLELNATYRSSAAAFTEFTTKQAEATHKTTAAVQESISEFGSLSNRYAINTEQVKELTKRSADLAAVKGITTVDAAHRLEAALRGEAESAEALGLTLNSDYLKKFADMTDAQRKNFETLDPLTKAQITYREVLRQTDAVQGQAVKRAGEAVGASDNLATATTNLAVTFGKGLSPSLAAAENAMAGWIAALDKGIQKSQEYARNQRVVNAGLTHGIVDIVPGQIQVGPDQGFPGAAGHDPTADQIAAADKGRKDALIRAAELDDYRKAQKKQREQDAKDGAEIAEGVHRREVKALDDKRTLLEAEREQKRRAVEDERDTALKGIEQEARAAKDASDAKIARLRIEQQEAQRVAQQAHEDATRRLAVEQKAEEDSAAETIRQQEIKRDRAKQAAEDRRDADIKALDAAARARGDERVKEDRAEDDHNTKVQRDLESQAKAAERRFDREAKAAEKAHDRTLRKIDEQGKREDDRHRKALANIDAESKRQLDAIDVQIRALDDAQHQDDNAGRVSDLQGKVSEAQAALAKARGNGTPEQIAGARADLTRALRTPGNDVGVANARETLNGLAGQGPEAIKKANEDLTKALADLQAEQVKQNRDGQKQKLEDQKAGIKAQADAEKDAENEKDRRRKSSLDKDKQAADDTYKSAKTSIDKRKQDEKDAHDLAVQQARDVAEQAKRAVDDRRRKEDQADQDKRKEITTTYEAEQRQIKATYDDEETGVIPAVRRALSAAQESFRGRKEAADDAYQDEQQQIQDTYTNAETGLIPVAERAAAKVAQGFQDQAAAVRKSATDQTQAINDVYANAGKTGLIDLIEQARKDSEEKLQNQRDYWKDWAEDLGGDNGQIKKVIDRFDDLIKKIEGVGGNVTVGPNVNVTEPSFRGDASDGGGPGIGVGGAPDPYAVQFPFGARYDTPLSSGLAVHRGVDLVVKGAKNGGKGSPVEAFEDGEVVYNGYDVDGGNGLILRGADGLYHRYFHFDSTDVGVGDKVKRGQKIGVLGETGTEGSPHLHYEVSKAQSGDPVGDLIDPMPYLRGAGQRSRSARTFEFDLFGKHYTVTLPAGTSNALIRQIEQLGTRIGGKDFGRAAAAIALSEGAAGDLGIPGTGGARGPFQFDPGGELPNYAKYLGVDDGAAGDYAAAHPIDAATWALRGYLGDSLREGLDQGLRGADLAEWGSKYGQRPAGDLWRLAGAASRQLYGYRHGGWIPTPSLIVDAATMTPYAYAGEAGPERVLSPEHSRSWGAGGSQSGGDTLTFNAYGGDSREVAHESMRLVQKDRMLRGGQRWR